MHSPHGSTGSGAAGQARLDADREDVHDDVRDAGVTTVEIIAWSAMLVVAIVAIAALLQVLGVEVIDYVRDQIGL